MVTQLRLLAWCTGVATCLGLTLALGIATGQELTMPAYSLPSEAGPSAMPTPVAEAIPSGQEMAVGEYMTEHEGIGPTVGGLADDYGMCDCSPLSMESTGTWLRRGIWYTEIDAVIMSRVWNHDDLILAGDANFLSDPQPVLPPGLGQFGRGMYLGRSDPGAEGSARFTLGRFLFRDVDNRDHTTEFSVLGGGQWEHNCQLESANPNGLFVAQAISRGNQSFDQASTMQVVYASRFNSFEWNYRVRERMQHDQMVLDPSGRWTRRANPGYSNSFLVGLRYLDLTENLDWDAQDVRVNNANEDGSYDVTTSNDLFGCQLGGSVTYESDRWSVEAGGRGGVYINDAKVRGAYSITNNDDLGFQFSERGNNLSFVGEFGLTGRWHLRPNLSLRAGWQMMYVSSVALAAHQLDFTPDNGKFSFTGDPFYHGAVFGFEGYW